MRIVGLLLLIWLIIGAVAVGQRGYFNKENKDCASIGTVVMTVLAGPLNYTGVNPVVKDCDLPQPSQ